MDPIMIGIAAVVLLVIFAGVFFMKKGKSAPTVDSQTQVKRPKTLAEQQRELELQRQSQQSAPTAPMSASQPTLQPSPVVDTQSAHSELQAAEKLIQTQEYDGAITILRRAVKNHPTRTDLHFALLNTYALAKDYQHFNTFYPEVIALNDFDLTTQANNLKILVDEEQSMSTGVIATPKAANTETASADTLDFDMLDFNQTTKKPAASDALALATTELPAVNTASVSTVRSTVNETTSDSDLDFDFALDDLDSKESAPIATSIEPAVTTTPVDELTFNDLDFDLPNKAAATELLNISSPVVESHTEIFAPTQSVPVETAKTLPAAIDSNSASDTDFDFNFNLPETSSVSVDTAATPVQPVVDTSITPLASEKPAEDFDFNFDLDVEPINTTAASPVTSPASTNATEFDINFDEPTNSIANTTVNTDIPSPVLRNDDSDLASFNLDEELMLQDDAASTAKLMTPDIADSITEAPASTASTKSESLISDDMFDFTLDDEPVKTEQPSAAITPTEPVASIGVGDTDDIIDLSFDEPVVTPASSSESPTNMDVVETTATNALVVEDLSAVFDVIKDIDTDTLNVDLAEQYLNLGEYDSAKRLLDEIKDTNNSALLERAEALRQRIA